jgi:predicted phage terminase large subunit-like protein
LLVNLTSVRAEIDRRNTERASAQAGAVETGKLESVRATCQTMSGFVREAWHVIEPTERYVHNWHIDVLCAHLTAVSLGTFIDLGYWNRILANIPPGMMKSLIFSVFWQAFEWGPLGMPSRRFMSSSHTEKFIARDTRKTRDLVASEWFQSLWPDVQLKRKGETSFENFDTGTREGVVYSGLTSGRGHVVTIDDPESTEDAESETQRETSKRITKESLPSRTNDARTSAIAIVQQRLHSEDVSAEALRQGYIHLMLPLEFEPERCCYTPLPNPDAPRARRMRYIATKQMWLPEGWGPNTEEDTAYLDEFRLARTQTVYRWDPRTENGELLFPERYPPEAVERDRAAMTAYAWNGQMQQRPSGRQGQVFSRGTFPFVDTAPNDTIWVRHWDLAGTKKKKRKGVAWTVGLKLGWSASRSMYYVGHVERMQGEYNDVRITILNIAAQDWAEHGPACEISIPQDPGQAGKAQAKSLVIELSGYVVHAERESGEKMIRAEPVASQAAAGNIAIVRGTGALPAWFEPWMSAIELAPNGGLDDVDAFSGAFTRLITKPGGGVRTGAMKGAS